MVIAHMERVEQPGLQIGEQVLAGDPVQDELQHIRHTVVVEEMDARLIGQRLGEEGGDPVRARLQHRGEGILVVAGAHAEQMAQVQFCQLVVHHGGHLVRKELRHPGLGADLPLLEQEEDAEHADGLARRKQAVHLCLREGAPVALGHQTSVAQDHQALHPDALLLDHVQEAEDRPGGKALGFGRCGWKVKNRTHGNGTSFLRPADVPVLVLMVTLFSPPCNRETPIPYKNKNADPYRRPAASANAVLTDPARRAIVRTEDCQTFPRIRFPILRAFLPNDDEGGSPYER